MNPRIQQLLLEAQGHYRAERLKEAAEIGRRILKINSKVAEAEQLLGLVALRQRRYSDVLRHYGRARALAPRNPMLPYLEGKALIEMDRLDDSQKQFDAALGIDPTYLPALAWKARVLERQGRRPEADAIVEECSRRGVTNVDLAEVHIRNRMAEGAFEDALDACNVQLADPGLHELNRHVLSFLSAQALEKLQRHEEAFTAYTAANAVLAMPFDARAFQKWVDALIEVFAADRLHALPASSSASEAPVFIAGMPRSGTTLLEQIIDAHPQAQGIGEVEDIEEIATTLHLGGRGYPQSLQEVDQRTIEKAAAEYLKRLRTLAPRKARVVNKSLENIWHVGLISRLFPGGRVIFVRRDPLDNCLSCFMSELMPGRMPWSTDLRHLGLVYREHERLLQHWLATLPIAMLEVQYEELIADLKGVTEGILEFLGLPWDERVVRFHESGRTALTLSYEQVRQPVYRSAIGRHRPYLPWLQPLLEALQKPEAACD